MESVYTSRDTRSVHNFEEINNPYHFLYITITMKLHILISAALALFYAVPGVSAAVSLYHVHK